MNYAKMYGRYIVLTLKSRMEYRFSFLMDILIHIFIYVINYMSLWIIFEKFKSISGWGFYEVMFLYNLNLLSYGFCCMFFYSPMQGLERMVQRGDFDSILVRPIKPFWHLIFRGFNHVFLGHIILAAIIFYVSISHLQVSWNLFKALMFLLVIIGGVLIQTAILVLSGSLSFWFVRSRAAVNTTIYGLRAFLDYPITIYPGWIQVILTFIVPYAFVNFYPSELFLQKSGAMLFHPTLQYGTPVVGILLFALSMKVWDIGVQRYQSTGS